MADGAEPTVRKHDLLRMTAEIVSAYVGHHNIPASEITEIIKVVHSSLDSLQNDGTIEAEPAAKPAISVRKSITPDYLICLEDGKKLKMLKRYLRTTYGLSPEDYRAKWGLPPDYPMVAPNYAEQRSVFAKKIGLGHKGRGGRGKA